MVNLQHHRHKHLEPFYESAKNRWETIQGVIDLFQKAESCTSARTIDCRVSKGSHGNGNCNNNDNNNDGSKGYKRQTMVLRPVNAREVYLLSSKMHCCCDVKGGDWSSVFLLYESIRGTVKEEECRIEEALMKQVSYNYFARIVVIGLDLSAGDSSNTTMNAPFVDRFHSLPFGFHRNSFVSDCILMPGGRAINCSVLERTFISRSSSVVNCGTISYNVRGGHDKEGRSSSFECIPNSRYLEMLLGPETGGRKVKIHGESTMIDVTISMKMSPNNNRFASLHHPNLLEYSKLSAPVNILCNGSYVCDTPSVNGFYLSSNSYIDAAASVIDVTLLEESSISKGSIVRDAILQWKASIVNGAHVNNALLMEYACAETAAIVNSSILGPDAHVGGGETQHTLLGPNTNAHHQSLMIGIIWPTGRGNIGYG